MEFDVIDSQADLVYWQLLTASVSFYLLRKTLLIKLNKSFHSNIFPARAVHLGLCVCVCVCVFVCWLSDIKSVAKAKEGCDYMEMAVWNIVSWKHWASADPPLKSPPGLIDSSDASSQTDVAAETEPRRLFQYSGGWGRLFK